MEVIPLLSSRDVFPHVRPDFTRDPLHILSEPCVACICLCIENTIFQSSLYRTSLLYFTCRFIQLFISQYSTKYFSGNKAGALDLLPSGQDFASVIVRIRLLLAEHPTSTLTRSFPSTASTASCSRVSWIHLRVSLSLYKLRSRFFRAHRVHLLHLPICTHFPPHIGL